MRWILVFMFLVSCNLQSRGVVISKEHNYKTKTTIKIPTDDRYFAFNKFEFYYPERFVVYFRGDNGKFGECEVSKTIYNVVRIGEKFDCDVLGKEALDEAVDISIY